MKNEKGPDAIPTEPTKGITVWRAMKGVSPRLNECWEWFGALWAFDYGDPTPLANLIKTEPIPPEFVTAVADIVCGARKANLKAASKAKIPAAERATMAAVLSVMLDLRDVIKFRAWTPACDVYGIRFGAVALSYGGAHEASEILRTADEMGRGVVEKAAKALGVSTETVENLMREARSRVSRWPTV